GGGGEDRVGGGLQSGAADPGRAGGAVLGGAALGRVVEEAAQVLAPRERGQRPGQARPAVLVRHPGREVRAEVGGEAAGGGEGGELGGRAANERPPPDLSRDEPAPGRLPVRPGDRADGEP